MTDETLLELVQSVGGLGDENQAVFTNDQLRLLIAMVRNAERESCAKVSLRPPQPAIFLSENISHAQFMAQFEEGDQS